MVIRREIKVLSGIRILGAIWVMLYHLQSNLYANFSQLTLFKPFLGLGDFGVDFFFILSGFVIWFNYGEEHGNKPSFRAFLKFIMFRIGRLWPVNVLATVLAALVLAVIHTHFSNFGVPSESWYNINSWLATVFMVQEVGNPNLVYMWNQPTWSVCAEFIVYFFFPIIAIVFIFISKKCNVFLAFFLSTLVLMSEPILVYYKLFAAPYGWLVRLFIGFISGVLLAITFSKIKNRKFAFSPFLHYFLPLIIVLVVFFEINKYMIIPLLGFWILSIATGRSLVSRFFSTKTMLMAGYASYSLYMLHWVFIALLNLSVIEWHILGSGWIGRTFLLLAILLMFLSSWACWKYYEEPSRRLMRSLSLSILDFMFGPVKKENNEFGCDENIISEPVSSS